MFLTRFHLPWFRFCLGTEVRSLRAWIRLIERFFFLLYRTNKEFYVGFQLKRLFIDAWSKRFQAHNNKGLLYLRNDNFKVTNLFAGKFFLHIKNSVLTLKNAFKFCPPIEIFLKKKS